jgi:hypothetical protein
LQSADASLGKGRVRKTDLQMEEGLVHVMAVFGVGNCLTVRATKFPRGEVLGNHRRQSQQSRMELGLCYGDGLRRANALDR